MTTETVPEAHDRSDTGPFAVVPLWVLEACCERGRAGHTALAVYAALSKWADYETGEAWPSHRTIGATCSLGTGAVKSAVKLLAEIGALSIRPRFRDDGSPTSNAYTVLRSRPRWGPAETEGWGPVETEGWGPVETRNETHVERDPEKNEKTAGAELALIAETAPIKATGPSFDDWYRRYPRKAGKAEAKKRWAAMSATDRADAVDALTSVEAQAAHDGTRYIPHASTWLNQRRWEDDPWAPPSSTNGSTVERSRSALDRFADRHGVEVPR